MAEIIPLHTKEENFNECIKEISELNIDRIRYITSHPRDMTDELMKSHKEIPKLQPYLHLPVQSGSDKILKEMNRNYTSQEYKDLIYKTREYRPDIAISGDFIVGFPGETNDDFEATLDIVKKVKYAHAYSFKYSPRPGTPAALKEDQIDEEVKTILHNQENRCRSLLTENRNALDLVARALLEHETISGEEVMRLTKLAESTESTSESATEPSRAD